MYPRRDLGTKIISSTNLALASPGLAAPTEGDDITPPNAEIRVSTIQLEDRLLTYEISAAVGDHVETQRHSIGAGGTNPVQQVPMSAADLQVWLDEKRQVVADNAAWHSMMNAAAEQVQ